MTLPAALFIIRCLVKDTFRQAWAARTFWLMLSVSALCIALCLSIHIENGQTLLPDGEIELYGGDNRPLTGPNPHPGHMTLAFGAIRLPLFRDGPAQIHFLQILLAFWVAGTIGLLVTLIWTAGFLPTFLEPSAASVLLAKPVPRWVLLLGKCLGVLLFVAFQEIVFFGGTWMALGLKTGIWSSGYLLCIPILLLHFAFIYSFSALMAVCTRSTVAAIFGSIVFWFLCYAANYGHYALIALPYLEPNIAPYSANIQTMAEAGYWVLPKPADLIVLLDQALDADKHFDVIPGVIQEAQKHETFRPELSILTSLGFSLALLLIGARQLAVTDY